MPSIKWVEPSFCETVIIKRKGQGGGSDLIFINSSLPSDGFWHMYVSLMHAIAKHRVVVLLYGWSLNSYQGSKAAGQTWQLWMLHFINKTMPVKSRSCLRSTLRHYAELKSEMNQKMQHQGGGDENRCKGSISNFPSRYSWDIVSNWWVHGLRITWTYVVDNFLFIAWSSLSISFPIYSAQERLRRLLIEDLGRSLSLHGSNSRGRASYFWSIFGILSCWSRCLSFTYVNYSSTIIGAT